ncbi:MAG TPA: hypothetical protein VFU78_14320 [Thermomicrobiales bacterium]|nr:hypothetical protein [Thermomicrobiales bacterium]
MERTRPPGRPCARPGGQAQARRGGDFCAAHAPPATPPAAPPAEPPTSAFQRLLASGQLADLLSQRLAQALAEAGRRETLTDEIGALRVVLLRLLDEEDDPHRLASDVARVVNAIVHALRAQRFLAGDTTGDLNELVTRVLAEIFNDK